MLTLLIAIVCKNKCIQTGYIVNTTAAWSWFDDVVAPKTTLET